MRRHFAWLLILGLAWASPAMGHTSVRFNIGFWAPPPPVAVFYEPPPMAWVPGTAVYYVDEDSFPYDCFRYGSYFYLDYDGYWYRSPGYRGPWIAIQAQYVPQPIFSVPVGYWHHRDEWGRWGNRGYDRDRSSERQWGRGGEAEHRWNGDRAPQRYQSAGSDRNRGGDRGWQRRGGEDRGDRGDHRDQGRHEGRGDRGDHGDHGDHGRG